jgi:hypothetical protein
MAIELRDWEIKGLQEEGIHPGSATFKGIILSAEIAGRADGLHNSYGKLPSHPHILVDIFAKKAYVAASFEAQLEKEGIE